MVHITWTLPTGKQTCDANRGVVISRGWVLRATALEARFEPHMIVTDLKAMGVPTT